MLHDAPHFRKLRGIAIAELSRKGFGCVAITGADGALVGIITDGDIRRHIGTDLLSMSVDQVMTKKPKTAAPDTLVATALQTINASAITSLMVVLWTNRKPNRRTWEMIQFNLSGWATLEELEAHLNQKPPVKKPKIILR